jgi:hypothetical protein
MPEPRAVQGGDAAFALVVTLPPDQFEALVARVTALIEDSATTATSTSRRG